MSLDPISMATQLASYEVNPFEYRISADLQTLSAERSAISSVNSKLSALNSFVKSLNSYSSSVIKNSATSSDEEMLTASASADAQSGSYQIFVEQLAQSHQLATQLPTGLTQDSLVPTSGTMKFEMNGESFTVDLASSVNADGDLDYMELMNAINSDSSNIGISASLVRSNDTIQLLFTSEKSGVANEIKVTSSTGDATFDASMDSANMMEMVKNQDAIAWLGSQTTGIKLGSESNTLSGVIVGVDITINKTHSSGDAPLTLAVGSDSDATNESMTEFVDNYNSVLSTINRYSATGSDTEARGILASDPISRGIESSLRSIMQQSFGGTVVPEETVAGVVVPEHTVGATSLYQMGLEFDRSGNLSFDSEKFEEFQETSSVNIDDIFRDDGMLLDQLEKKLDLYSNSTTGSLKSQLESIDSQEARANDKLESLDRRYEMFYTRYLKQFAALSSLQTKMENLYSMF